MWCIDCIVLLAIKVASIGFNWIEKKSRFTPWIHPNKTTKHACTPMCNGNRSFSKGMDINELVSVLRIFEIPMIKCHMLTCVNLICVTLLLMCIDKTRWACVSSWGPSWYKEATIPVWGFPLKRQDGLMTESYYRITLQKVPYVNKYS